MEVMAGTPAAKGGLRAGDTIIAVDGQPVRSPHDLTDRLDHLPAQSTIRLEIVRGRGSQRQRMILALQTSSRMEAGSQANLSPPDRPTEDQPALTKTPQPDHGRAGSLRSLPGRPLQIRRRQPVPKPIKLWPPPMLPPHPSTTNSTPATQPRRCPPNHHPPIPEMEMATPRRNPGEVPRQRCRFPNLHAAPSGAAVPPPQPEELKLTLPRAVVERIEQLERRLEKAGTRAGPYHFPGNPPDQLRPQSLTHRQPDEALYTTTRPGQLRAVYLVQKS